MEEEATGRTDFTSSEAGSRVDPVTVSVSVPGFPFRERRYTTASPL